MLAICHFGASLNAIGDSVASAFFVIHVKQQPTSQELAQRVDENP